MTQRRLPPAQRREQIVDSARSVIGQRGLAGVSLRDIAAAAGVSMGTVTYHFSSIDEILGAVVVSESERFYAGVVAAADAEADARRALGLLIDPLFVDTPEVTTHWRLWTDYWAVVARRPGMTQPYADRVRIWEECCTRVIARGVADGSLRQVDPAQAALKLSAFADGLWAQRGQEAPGLTSALAHAWMSEFIDLLLLEGSGDRPPHPPV